MERGHEGEGRREQEKEGQEEEGQGREAAWGGEGMRLRVGSHSSLPSDDEFSAHSFISESFLQAGPVKTAAAAAEECVIRENEHIVVSRKLRGFC